MRTTPLAVAALAAALLLTACDSDGGDDGDKNKADAGCTLGVDVAASAAPAAGDTGNVTVTLTNRDAKCVLNGFPAVDLLAGGETKTVPADKSAEPRKLTLAKDATASFTITYTRGGTGKQSLPVKSAKFTLPGSTAGHSFTWSYGEVALQGNTPNASVTPFTQAGD
ncbi:DUF4232 domain-containing protein [Streptomyces sp. NPDC094149]|uniref:DUF4232 domain-containing protein n=1 Tax=Streptomyces sp. NPDC094149 TaxID=3155079 RepID=UPI0033327F8B